MTDAAIVANGLTRRFGDLVAVNDVDLEIAHGQIYGFLGPNGSGKTTLIRMLCGLLTPSAGTARALDFQLPEQAEPLRRRIGYMTQKFSLFDDLSCKENLNFLARIYGLDNSQRQMRITTLLNQFNLEPLSSRQAGAMSGGQRQRLALAAATLHEPELLFLDEPTSAVDPQNRRDFWETLFDLSEAGTTLLVSTHYMDEAERCHQLAILDNGNLKTQGVPADLMGALKGRVIDVQGDGLRAVRQQLMTSNEVLSAAQQGDRLRVLLKKPVQDIGVFKQWLPGDQTLHCEPAKATLEDVFVETTQADETPC
ncbi:ABC transporter ATP-binding protein [Halioglobus pacificus]|uniref:ABC transporter ATP-binding protein n=1 Tax=Parahalioglobus pacificus TaxID=930806 RepID=A0A918XJY9_9GAMM|nr:ABC transporter ATP-binding protein [Halioglobus pacificus]GHD35708.1 ABC transporter ATP-binding protein [Halioglobus pacificus]